MQHFVQYQGSDGDESTVQVEGDSKDGDVGQSGNTEGEIQGRDVQGDDKD